jgi:tetratricopeptide (TPR) repeat protein
MKILSKLKAQYFWSLGLKRFCQGKQDEAVLFFEKAGRLDPTNYGDALHYSFLGRGYLALDRAEEALSALSRAYELFLANDPPRWSEYEREQFVATLKAFANALHRCGQFERAKQVVQEVTEHMAGRRDV